MFNVYIYFNHIGLINYFLRSLALNRIPVMVAVRRALHDGRQKEGAIPVLV